MVSLWRRAHQAIARRWPYGEPRRAENLQQGREPPSLPVSAATTTLHRRSARLTDDEWTRLRPLLPDNGHRGKQWREHRTVVEAILWVLTSSASWRDLPEEFGPWQTAYYRYARWRQEGLWQQIVEMLRC